MNVPLNYTAWGSSLGTVRGVVTLLMQTLSTKLMSHYPWPSDYGPTALQYGLPEYDFIVIGAGSAGSVVANRLSENRNWNILLLEAGGDPPVESEVPALLFSMLRTEYDWKFYAEPSDQFGKIYDHGVYMPRGKMLGGSSSLNGMFYLRGFRHDYDEWAEMGNEGWGFENILKYFKKSENNQASELLKNFKYHSTTGPMKVDFYKSNNTVLKVMLKGVKERGFKEVEDFNSDQELGFAFIQGTLTGGRRQGTAQTFLSPIKNRSNLHVIKMAHVTHLDIENDKVTGVNFNYNSMANLKARARKETILSAGAIGSPQILMLSGIGPRNLLEKFNIEVMEDLPVGYNFQDHVFVPLFFSFTGAEPPLTALFFIEQLYKYSTTKTGLFSTIPGDMLGFLNTDGQNEPNIQVLHFVFQPQFSNLLDSQYLEIFGFPTDIKNLLMNINGKSSIMMAVVTLIDPKSKGRIVLQSKNPEYKPKLYPNYLENSQDIKTIVSALQIYSEVENTNALRKYDGQLIQFVLPECDIFQYRSIGYWECYARQFSTSQWHQAGTVKMGPADDETSVVTPNLKVKGIDNLRVIDASIMPNVISSNANTATIMIGERGADLIKESWGVD